LEPFGERLLAARARAGGQQGAAGGQPAGPAGQADRDHHAAAAGHAHELADQGGQPVDLGAGQLRCMAHGWASGQREQVRGDLPGGDGSGGPGGHGYDRALDPVQQLGRELVELGGPQHGPRDGPGLDQLLLAELAPVVTGGYAVDADDGQGDVVPHPGAGLGGQQVAGGRAEELNGLGRTQRCSVRYVDHGVGALQRVSQASPGDQIDAGRSADRHGLVPGGPDGLDHVPPHDPGPARDGNPHPLQLAHTLKTGHPRVK
jgi:hypothetical protein